MSDDVVGPPPSVVCGVDQSAHARTVAAFAAGLAERLRLRLVLVHAVPMIAPALGHAWPVRAPHDPTEAREAGERLLAELAGEVGTPAGLHLANGPAPESLVHVVVEEAARYLVVGTHGHGTARVVATGSVSLTASRLATCPVIVLREGIACTPLSAPDVESVVCGLANGVDLEPLRVADDLARALELHVVPAHAVAEAPDDRGAVHVADIRRHVNGGLAVLAGDPAEELARLAERSRAAMIVVGSRGRGALRASLLGSVSRSLARASAAPVVVCPPRAPVEEDQGRPRFTIRPSGSPRRLQPPGTARRPDGRSPRE